MNLTASEARALLAKPKPSKYRNRKTVVDGIAFDSAKEAKRWCELLLLERAGEIRNLRRQTKYRLDVNGKFIGHYKDDFSYDKDDKRLVICWRIVEDVKSKATRTPVYRLKKRLMLACHAITVTEV